MLESGWGCALGWGVCCSRAGCEGVAVSIVAGKAAACTELDGSGGQWCWWRLAAGEGVGAAVAASAEVHGGTRPLPVDLHEPCR